MALGTHVLPRAWGIAGLVELLEVRALADAMVNAGGHWCQYPPEEARLRATLVVEVLVQSNTRWLRQGYLVDEDSDISLILDVMETLLRSEQGGEETSPKTRLVV